MSKITLEGNASGTGTFTIAAPNSNTSYTLTLPQTSGTILTSGGSQTIEFVAGSASTPSITFTGDTNTGIFSPAADTIAFTEGGAESMRIDSSGNLGIGTTSPTRKLTVVGDTTNYGVLTRNPSGYGGINLSSNTITGQVWSFIAQDNGANSDLSIYGGASAGTKLTIDSSGNVGIGTNSPGANRLSVVGGSLTVSRGSNGVSGSFASNDGTNNTTLQISHGTSGITLANSNPFSGAFNNLMFSNTTVGETMRIDPNGNLLVGTTSRLFNDKFNVTTVNGTVAYSVFHNQNSSAGTEFTIVFARNSTTVGSISTTLTTTIYNTSSDYRLKNTIAPMTGALAKVALLKPCTYKWNVDGSNGQGFIAHELQDVVPECVTGEKDATEIRQVEVSPAVPATYDDEGNELTPAVEAVYEEREVPVYQGVDTSFLVATLTAAIQELKAINDAQATRIETLETKVAALEAK
jgi:hypothetical protein